MTLTRRQTLTGGAMALFGAGFLGRVDKVAAAQRPLSLKDTLGQQATGTSEKLLLGPTPGEEGPPEPANYDRLPLEWNRKTVRRFKDKLAERDIEAFLVQKPLNVIYLTGYWHSTTERPQATFFNRDNEDPWFLYPSLDRDLVTSWWFGSGRMYFDFHHAKGAFPHEGKAQQGEKVDLFEFMLEGLKEHGVQGTRIGLDGELYPSQLAKAEAILPGIEFIDVSEILMDMREVKTPEELALWRRAYLYFDRAHGAGVEGHQSPYIALGDYTMMVKDMCFSEEPGLYDPSKGCGFNWSNTIVVGKKSGYRMSRVPYSKEWCWLKI